MLAVMGRISVTVIVMKVVVVGVVEISDSKVARYCFTIKELRLG